MEREIRKYVRCKICGKKRKQLTCVHLKTHGITVQEYRMKFPTSKVSSGMTTAKRSKSMQGKNKGENCSEETRRKKGEAVKGEKNGMFGKTHTEEALKAMSEALTGEKHPLYGIPCPGERKRKISITKQGVKLSEEHKKNIGEGSKLNWQDSEYQKKVCKGLALKPNKPETVLLNLLNRLYPNEWKYTGDFSFMINGKNPDFTNVNGHKKLIEMFGDYWHQGENPEDRKKIFREFGYETLVIWESELKDLSMTTFRIHKFVRG